VVADAVAVEPVSTPKFPANREINKEFGKIWPQRLFLVSIRRMNLMTCRKIPCGKEQGINFMRTANFCTGTGKNIPSRVVPVQPLGGQDMGLDQRVLGFSTE
jgi:hypothetical protein